MTAPRIGDLIERAASRLSHLERPEWDAEFLFRGICGLTRAALLARFNEPASPEVVARFEGAVTRRQEHEPLQYILGSAAFWRDEFAVDPSVLIPRPETEILVEAVAVRLTAVENPSLLDLGTGSGCIALSLLRELPGASVLATDVSTEALAVAALNARRLGLAERISLAASRWFEGVDASMRFDAIVSNPPYVAREDETALPREVRAYEPELALFAEDGDDLSSYRAITAGAGSHLKTAGLLALEVGQGQAARVAAIMTGAGLRSIEVLADLAGVSRVVLGRGA